MAREIDQVEYKLASEYIQNNRQNSFRDRLLNVITLGAIDDKLWSEEKKRRLGIATRQMNNPWWNKINPRKSDAYQLPGQIEYYDDPRLLQNKPWEQRVGVLFTHVISVYEMM